MSSYPIARARALSGLAAALLLTTAACKKKDAGMPATDSAPAAQSNPSSAPAAPTPIPAQPTPLAVGGVTMGKSIDADKKVSNATTTFGVHDTIYAVVNTTGGGSGTLEAKWSFVKAGGGETSVNQSSISIAPTGPLATEFHLAKATPWPKGKYKVEILMNGTSAGTTEFEVK
jgi:hypothetical protein